MPHIRKPTYTRPIPPGAEPCQVEGKPGIRWKGRGGRWVYGIIGRSPGRCLVRSGKFRIFYTDHESRPTSTRGYADRQASEYRMRELATQAERIHAGQLAPQAARPRLTLTELLDRWERSVVHRGADPRGAKRQRQQAGDVCEGVGAVRVSDLTPTGVLEWIGERLRANRHGKRAFGKSTAAAYIGSIKSFTRWCSLFEKAEPIDYLAALQRRRDDSDPRHQRRVLSPKELDRLLSATRASETVIYGLSGPERHALYLLACSTGLRASELASLAPSSFDVAAGEVTIEARRAKNKRRATLPVEPRVLAVVKRLFRGEEPLWPNRGAKTQAWWANGARMIARDLNAAGIAPVVEGRAFDFHSLRSQFATDLDRAGVSLTRAQKLMRHSDPKLTAKFYQRPDRAELASEVGKLKRGKR